MRVTACSSILVLGASLAVLPAPAAASETVRTVRAELSGADAARFRRREPARHDADRAGIGSDRGGRRDRPCRDPGAGGRGPSREGRPRRRGDPAGALPLRQGLDLPLPRAVGRRRLLRMVELRVLRLRRAARPREPRKGERAVRRPGGPRALGEDRGVVLEPDRPRRCRFAPWPAAVPRAERRSEAAAARGRDHARRVLGRHPGARHPGDAGRPISRAAIATSPVSRAIPSPCTRRPATSTCARSRRSVRSSSRPPGTSA